MIYLDYSATTPCDEQILISYTDAVREFFSNPNSNHTLGLVAKKKYLLQGDLIAGHLSMPSSETVFTSGATEANNLAIRGIKHKEGAHAITTLYEHSSVNACFAKLQKEGVSVDFAPTTERGLIDLEGLKKLIRPDTYLVSIGAVNSEIGLVQDLDGIKKMLNSYPQLIFHSDITQALGKIALPINMPDLVSLSAHKIYGLKGAGALVKPKTLDLDRVLMGGESLSKARPGTPDLPMAIMVEKAVALALSSLDEHQESIAYLSSYLRDKLSKNKNVHINSNEHCLPQILNIPLPGFKASVVRDILASQEIYVSTQTACRHDADYSDTILRLTNDLELAASSIRISLSHLTTLGEIERLVEVINERFR